jgi:glutamine cyclotransferase
MHKRVDSKRKEVTMNESGSIGNRQKKLFVLCAIAFLVLVFLYFGKSAGSPTRIHAPVTPIIAVRSAFTLSGSSGGEVTNVKVSVVASFYHNESHFTQGFEIVDGYLYEGTGMNTQSALMKKNLTTGRILVNRRLEAKYFGEGITVFGNYIYQLTWKNRVGFYYDKSEMNYVGSWNYNYEGWGLTHDDKYLIVSDGTSLIRFLDPEGDLSKPVKAITVKYPKGKEQDFLNELEYIDGNIWANVWQTNMIVVINPISGDIVAKLDLSKIRKSNELSGDVLNGIALDKATGKVYVTGKYWKMMYEIEPA